MQSTKSIIVQLAISTATNNPDGNKPSTTTKTPSADLTAGTTSLYFYYSRESDPIINAP
jgi:hypothetical protein